MANGENYNLLAVVVIKDDVSSLTKLNDPFTKFQQSPFHGPTDFRMTAQDLDAFADYLDGTRRGINTLRS